MAISTRQYGRRGASNAAMTTASSTNASGVLLPSSAGATSIPPRRYVLDVPTGRTVRTNHMTTTTSLTNVNNENGERLSRSGSREYYYRDGGNESSTATVTRYLEDASYKQLVDSSTNYRSTLAEDQEVQALTAQATPDVKNYPINVDSNPDLIVKPNTQRLTYTQDIAVRYLKPGTPPPPGPIIIREIRAPPPPAAPPMILRQRPPPPRTPSPVIIREKPPQRPKSVPTTVIKKVIPPPPPPPRKLIIERLPNLPPKPRPVIIERWLPYQKQKRQVIHEKAKPLEPMSRIKNTIIEWRPPEVEVVKRLKKLGVQDTDPQRYSNHHGDKLYTTEFVQQKLTELGLQEEIALMQQQQASAVNEEITLEKADEYNVQQILNGYGTSASSRQTYTTNTSGTAMRLARSSSHSRVGETGYESAGETASGYTEEKYVQIKASELKDVLANYDVYSSSGQKLEGEQLNF
ncbi:unnamed protein product [Rotaria magnacalcarata]|uniref:Uncharacterized protein n=1 Tax=Rotaria magnacalcarata TaxID=392030 RepID=A0A8S2ISM4_9BILA|nr:unnamed protein product [Rotaria magnacalcarata]